MIATLAVIAGAALVPARAWPCEMAFLAVGAMAAVASPLSWRSTALRLSVIGPVLVFAVVAALTGGGSKTHLAGIPLSTDGLWSGSSIIAKAVTGVLCASALTAWQAETGVLTGLRRLRVPSQMVEIAAFMLRYVSLVDGELRRRRTAMIARGHDPRWLWQVGPLAASTGSVFVRSYERGERVHAAMLARGYTGTLPADGRRRASRRDWLRVTAVALASAAVVVVGVRIA